MTFLNVLACIGAALASSLPKCCITLLLLVLDWQPSPYHEWGSRKGKGHKIPLAPCAKSGCSPTPGTQDWVCGSSLTGLLLGSLCIAAGDILLSPVSLLGKKWEGLRTEKLQLSKYCYSSYSGLLPKPCWGTGPGQCCPCTRSWRQLGPWHRGLKAPPQPWEVLCQGSRWYHFRETSPLAQLSWWEKMPLPLQGV